MKTNKILKETTLRSEYNKAYKQHLEAVGKIRCSWCSYHGGENDTRKWYGSRNWWKNPDTTISTRYPNWKLVSKNKKQWMNKNIKVTKRTYNRWDLSYEYVEIKW